MTDSLIQRLSEAEGPDRELDRDIFLFANPFSAPAKTYKGMAWVKHDKAIIVPDYTASLDAAIGLCERVLSDWTLTFNSIRSGGWEVDLTVFGLNREADVVVSAEKKTPALALCLALLKALKEKQS